MVALAAEAARTHTLDEKSLRLTLAEIAQHSYGVTVNEALEEGWKQAVAHSMADGIMSLTEENKLQESRDRIMPNARLAALAIEDPTRTLTNYRKHSTSRASTRTSR